MARPRLDGTPPREPNRRKLTDFFVSDLKPLDRPFAVWDEKQKGLAIFVQTSGTKAWKFVYHLRGRGPRWYHIASVNSIGLAEARRLAARIAFEVAEGKDPAADRRARRSSGTFAELASRYVEEHAKRTNRSWAQAEALVRRNLVPRLGKLRAADVTRDDVKAAFAAIASPTTANQTLAAASAIFSFAIREGIGEVKINPCALVRRNETQSRERVLSDSELRAFWAAFDDVGLVRGSALKVILLTGQRPGEVSAMRREHVVDGWWNLPGAPDPKLDWPGTKNGASHRVWLSKPVRDLIDDLDENGDGRIFSGKLDAAMRSISATLGVATKVTPHDLRRTCLSKITGLGFGRDAMDRIANHRSREITDVYDRHSYGEEDRRIMEAVGAAIVDLAEGGGKENVVLGKFRR